MPRQLMGKKKGMTMIFDQEGRSVPCTVIEVEPNVVTQLKTKERDGYTAVQRGFDKFRAKDERTIARRCGKPQMGAFVKQGVAPRRHLYEVRVEETTEYQVGEEISVGCMAEVSHVDVAGVSKGKGYQGVMRKYGFAGAAKASHGAGPVHRHAGSTGMRSTPGRCLKGGKRASRMGGYRRTVQGLKLLRVDQERNLLLVKGGVPGPVGGYVMVSEAIKKCAKAQ